MIKSPKEWKDPSARDILIIGLRTIDFRKMGNSTPMLLWWLPYRVLWRLIVPTVVFQKFAQQLFGSLSNPQLSCQEGLPNLKSHSSVFWFEFASFQNLFCDCSIYPQQGFQVRTSIFFRSRSLKLLLLRGIYSSIYCSPSRGYTRLIGILFRKIILLIPSSLQRCPQWSFFNIIQIHGRVLWFLDN